MEKSFLYNINLILEIEAPDLIEELNYVLWTKKLYNKLIKLSSKSNKKLGNKKLLDWLKYLISNYSIIELSLNNYTSNYNSNDNIDNITILNFMKELNNGKGEKN
jgi:hypothetical protein